MYLMPKAYNDKIEYKYTNYPYNLVIVISIIKRGILSFLMFSSLRISLCPYIIDYLSYLSYSFIKHRFLPNR